MMCPGPVSSVKYQVRPEGYPALAPATGAVRHAIMGYHHRWAGTRPEAWERGRLDAQEAKDNRRCCAEPAERASRDRGPGTGGSNAAL